MQKNNLKKVCEYIGCTGVDKNCPGNKQCYILRKIIIAMEEN